jgi:hypothetical protein
LPRSVGEAGVRDDLVDRLEELIRFLKERVVGGIFDHD